jgi:dTDP-4-amino-4,6-dideoxygalactose transaminase
MSILMTDLKAQYESIKSEIDAAMQEVLNETNFIQGKQAALFEEDVCKYFGSKFAVGVASGTDALVLALEALGIGKGDEVVTTPFTFIATAEAISRVGAKPVFCDIDSETYNIDPDKIKSRITAKTKAILPVHLYGMPCEMDEILSIARANKLIVVEDCAQSFGSEYKNKKTGCFGNCGCLSFFPAKNLGCYGDGGMVITDEEETAKKLKMLRNHGSTSKYIYGMHGFNSRLDTLQAALLRVKLKYIDKWIELRIANAGFYNQALLGTDGIITPKIPDKVKHSFNYYTIRLKNFRREGIQEKIKEKGVPSAIYYPLSLHLQVVYEGLGYKKGDFPVAESMQEEVLSLPMYPELDRKLIYEIANNLKSILVQQKAGLFPAP